MEQKKTKAETSLFDIIIYAMMIVAVIYVIVQSVMGNNNKLHFKITLGIWILAAVIVTDFVAPFVQKKFDGLDRNAFGMYGLYAIADGAMFVFFYIFVINVGLAKEPLHYVALGLAAMLFVGRTFAYKAFEKARDELTGVRAAQTESGGSDASEYDYEESDVDISEDDGLQILIYRDKK